jgi:uncharacterized protein (TIGR00255 family)
VAEVRAQIVPLVSLVRINYNSVMDVIPLSFSMTGYGQSSLQFGGYKITFEVKSVNHRYCEVVLRMPRDWMVYEDVLKRKVQQHIKRGRVDVVVNRERDEEAAAGRVLSRSAVKSYLEAADVLKCEFGLSGELGLRDLLSLPGVMESREETAGLGPVSPEALSEMLEDGLEQSLQSLMEMRVREGSHLSGDLEQRLNHLERLHADMAELAPTVVGEYRDKLRQRLGELADGTFPFDEHKFGMEVAIFFKI